MPDTAAPRPQSIPACPRRFRRRHTGGRQFDEEPLNLGDVVDAVMAFAADGDEGALVIEGMLSSGLIRLPLPAPSRAK